MADFGMETLTLKKGKSVMAALREALKKKGQEDRMDSDTGIFILNDVAVLSIKDDKVECKVDYEYGG